MPVTASYISKKPDRCGGDACIRETRIPVWMLVGYRRLGASDADVFRAYHGRTATPDPDVLARAHSLGRAVLTYNRRHYERLHRKGTTHSGILPRWFAKR